MKLRNRQSRLSKHIQSGNVSQVKHALAHYPNEIETHKNHLLRYATHDMRVNIVKVLLCDQRINPNLIVQWAVSHRKLEVIDMLISDKRTDNNECNKVLLKFSVGGGFTEWVKILLTRSLDRNFNYNHLLELASVSGYTGIVKLLLSQNVDPNSNNSGPLRMALFRNHEEICELLIMDERLKITPQLFNIIVLHENMTLIELALKNGCKISWMSIDVRIRLGYITVAKDDVKCLSSDNLICAISLEELKKSDECVMHGSGENKHYFKLEWFKKLDLSELCPYCRCSLDDIKKIYVVP